MSWYNNRESKMGPLVVGDPSTQGSSNKRNKKSFPKKVKAHRAKTRKKNKKKYSLIE